MVEAIRNISLVGAGRVAWHLAQQLHEHGYVISEVWSRKLENATELAKLVNAQPKGSLNFSSSGADLIVLAVADAALPAVVSNLKIPAGMLVVHTSGSQPMAILTNKGVSHAGVFYPLQTFSKEKTIDWQSVPLCLEASKPADYLRLEQLAIKLSKQVVALSSLQRSQLHLAAVFACNFSNHMLHIAAQLLKGFKLPKTLLNPLVHETLEKAIAIGPAAAQTGPALRRDDTILRKHQEQLGHNANWQQLYKLISQDILVHASSDKL